MTAARYLVSMAVEHQMFLLINGGSGDFDDATRKSGLQSTNEMSGWAMAFLIG